MEQILTLTEDQASKLRAILGSMPYGSIPDMHVKANKQTDPIGYTIEFLRGLKTTLEDFSQKQTELEAEVNRYRRLHQGAGELLKVLLATK